MALSALHACAFEATLMQAATDPSVTPAGMRNRHGCLRELAADSGGPKASFATHPLGNACVACFVALRLVGIRFFATAPVKTWAWGFTNGRARPIGDTPFLTQRGK